MSVTHNIQMTYSGGGSTPVQRTVTATGQSEVNFDTACSGSATTSLAPILYLDPDAAIEAYCFLATGNCTLQFDAQSGTDTTIALAANTAEIAYAGASGLIAGVPTAADTITLKVQNAGSDSLTFTGRMVIA